MKKFTESFLDKSNKTKNIYKIADDIIELGLKIPEQGAVYMEGDTLHVNGDVYWRDSRLVEIFEKHGVKKIYFMCNKAWATTYLPSGLHDLEIHYNHYICCISWRDLELKNLDIYPEGAKLATFEANAEKDVTLDNVRMHADPKRTDRIISPTFNLTLSGKLKVENCKFEEGVQIKGHYGMDDPTKKIDSLVKNINKTGNTTNPLVTKRFKEIMKWFPDIDYLEFRWDPKENVTSICKQSKTTRYCYWATSSVLSLPDGYVIWGEKNKGKNRVPQW